jgi:hypothetical protein
VLNEFAIKDGRVLVKKTGAELDLNKTLIKDVARGVLFASEVTAIVATRAARTRLMSDPTAIIRIAFGPVRPNPWYAIWPVCRLGYIEIVNDPADADILFYFEDKEYAQDIPFAGANKQVLNGQCLDIRKSKVAEVFEQTFGYPLSIDPTTYHGLAVRKSEMNGVHDGQIVPCPTTVPRDNLVYQRLVENTHDGKTYTDIRTPIVGGTIPTVYLKRRTANGRFSNDNTSVILTSADAQFSPHEQERILTFAKRMKLDFGGMDILRHRRDGRLFIVDVNKTDMGPPTALARTDKHIAMKKLSAAFRGFVIEKLREQIA